MPGIVGMTTVSEMSEMAVAHHFILDLYLLSAQRIQTVQGQGQQILGYLATRGFPDRKFTYWLCFVKILLAALVR